MDDATPTRLWLIEPAAHPDDDAWQDRPVWAEVIVAAESPAFARLAAERQTLSASWTPIGNASESRRAGLNDEKLYHVRELPEERRRDFPAELNRNQVVMMRALRPARRP